MGMNPRLLRPILSGDPDALRYIAAVQAADQQSLEPAVRKAITDFIVGCKQDGIWNAIKASCLLMGARTLSGALTPLVGAAPTNNGPFVSGDYDRETGLLGNGTSKFLDIGRNNTAEPQNSKHLAAFVSDQPNPTSAINYSYLAGGGNVSGRSMVGRQGSVGRLISAAVNSGPENVAAASAVTGFHGVNRSSSSELTYRVSGDSTTVASESQTPADAPMNAFVRTDTFWFPGRLTFYSTGESLNIAFLDSRVTTLYNAIGAAL